jgi:hypothetical protein
MYNIVKENQDLFIAVASILNTKGADIEMEGRFEDGKYIYSNMPEVRGYVGPEGEGFYFRANRSYFGLSADALMASFPITIDGYKFEAVSFGDYEVDIDDDRTWPESISFIITKEGKNII